MTSSNGVVEARRAILAVAPAQRLDIDIAPALPIEYQQLAQRLAAGRADEVLRRHLTRSGGAKGPPGRRCRTRVPCSSRSTCSPGAGGPGILLGFRPMRADSTGWSPPSVASRPWRASPRCSARKPCGPLGLHRPALGLASFAPGGSHRGGAARSWTQFARCLGKPVGSGCTGRAPRRADEMDRLHGWAMPGRRPPRWRRPTAADDIRGGPLAELDRPSIPAAGGSPRGRHRSACPAPAPGLRNAGVAAR